VQEMLTVSIGILDSSLIYHREVFKDGILASSASIIVVHNHHSVEDRRVTHRLYEAGQ